MRNINVFTKDFVYLVQGQSNLVAGYVHLAERKRADAIFMTYDEPLNEAVFFPDSTWAEGRNRLLQIARDGGPYRYYVFCDDDVAFDEGGWQEFEDGLLDTSPSVGVPVFPKTRATPLPGLDHQPFGVNDEQMIAIHHDVVEDNLLFPYQTQFDSLNWWAACEVQEILIQTFYRNSVLQFNRVMVRNECSLRYSGPDESKYTVPGEGRRLLRPVIYRWLDAQFVGPFRHISTGVGRYQWRLWKLVILTKLQALASSRGVSYRLAPTRVARMLAPGSELLAQYRAGSAVVPRNHGGREGEER